MNDNATAWVAALRSGKYQQGQFSLRRRDDFCCLGVACELYRQATGDGVWSDGTTPAVGKSFQTVGGSSWLSLPYSVRDWLGLDTVYGRYDPASSAPDTCGLTILNDNGQSFEEIADVIESEPKGLFV